MTKAYPLQAAAPIVGVTASVIDPTLTLAITPILHPQEGAPDPRSRTFWSAVANVLYIRRQHGTDLFGPTPDLSAKLAQGNDLIACGRRGPIGCDAHALADLALWDAADRAARADRPSAPVAHHVIGWLPVSAVQESWRDLVLEFLDRAVVPNGIIADGLSTLWQTRAAGGSSGLICTPS